MEPDKRTKILKAALELFTEHGFRGTSTAEIARSAGVATGTLFHHFRSKEVLIEELYVDAKTALAEHICAKLDKSANFRDQLRSLWYAFCCWGVENESQYRFFKHCDASPYISESVRNECAKHFAFISDLFSEAAKVGAIKDVPVDLLMNLYWGLIEGFLRHLIQNPQAREDELLWEKVFSIGWDAIR